MSYLAFIGEERAHHVKFCRYLQVNLPQQNLKHHQILQQPLKKCISFMFKHI